MANLEFLNWLRKREPRIFKAALSARMNTEAMPQRTSIFGMGEIDPVTGLDLAPVAGDDEWYEKLFSTVKEILPSVLQFQTGKELVELNIERAKAGLDPIDVSQISPQLNVGIAPQTQKMIMYGGAAILALLALNMFRKRI